MTRPNLLVVGAMKAGTTALHEYLAAQPGVFMSDPKELDFFRADGNWSRGVDWYESHFERAAGEVIVGESSPNYSKRHSDPGVVERMVMVVPEARLVYMVRHPIERIVSMYRHLVAERVERRPFHRAVLEDPDYVDTSRYAYQLEAFLDHYPRSNVLVVPARRLRDDRTAVVSEILAFGGIVDATPAPGSLAGEPNRADARRVRRRTGRLRSSRSVRNVLDRSWRLRRVHQLATTRPASPVEVVVTPELEAALVQKLAPDVRRLKAIIGPQFDGWGLA